MIIRLQTEDFDPECEAEGLVVHGAGARVSFVGTVRDSTGTHHITALEIEHYPAMTKRELTLIAQQACANHDLLDALIVHRFGRLEATERIVLVTVWAKHRAAAFAGCQEIVDVLKTRAPFWKKEITDTSAHWVTGTVPPMS